MIDLEGCDAVLSSQWLRTLGPIVWNFGSMKMSSTVGKSEVRLVGLGHTETKQVGSRVVNKILQKNNGKGMLFHIRL